MKKKMTEEEHLRAFYVRQGRNPDKLERNDQSAFQKVQRSAEYEDIKDDVLNQLGVM